MSFSIRAQQFAYLRWKTAKLLLLVRIKSGGTGRKNNFDTIFYFLLGIA